MPSTYLKRIMVCSARDLVNSSKITGAIDFSFINKYRELAEILDYAKNISGREILVKDIQNTLSDLQYSLSDITTNVKSVLPDYPYVSDPDTGVPSSPGGGNIDPVNVVTATNFTTTTIIQETLFGVGTEFDTYELSESDFLAAYSDNNDNNFYAIKIDRTNLDGMSLKYNSSPTTGNVFGENSSTIMINRASLSLWSLYTSSTTVFSHQIRYKFVDLIDGKFVESDYATFTVDRTSQENRPATIGDNTIIVNNRAVTTLTLAMFTTQLTPPYSDPDNDLIDAIRLDEISTANQGVFKLNGAVLATGQIITREDINAGLFTHEAGNIDTLSSDVFSFSARDEGSQIWVQ